MTTAIPTPKRNRPWMQTPTTERYVTYLDPEGWYAIDYSFERGNEVAGPFATEDEAARA